MKPQNKLLLWTFLLLVFLTALFLWLTIGNRGFLSVQNLEGPYMFSVEKYRIFECKSGLCRFSLPFGTKHVCLQKAGYHDYCLDIRIRWRQEVSFLPELKKIPALVEVPLPLHVQNGGNPVANDPLRVVTGSGKQYFLQPETGELFLKGSDDASQNALVTVFHGLADPQLFPLGENILILSKSEVFLVDTERKSRARVYSGGKLGLKPLTKTQAVIADTDQLFLFDSETGKLDLLPFVTLIAWVVTCNEGTMSFAAKSDDGIVRFLRYDLATRSETKISSAEGITENFSLRCGEAKNSLFLIFESGKQMELTY